MLRVRCPKGHKKVWKKGTVPTRRGHKQRYVCFTCGRTFYRWDNYSNKRRNPDAS